MDNVSRWTRPTLTWADHEDAPSGLALCDDADRFLEVNSALCEILERSREELLGLRYADMFEPSDHAEAQVCLAQLLTGEVSMSRCEERVLRPGGEVRWVATTASRASADPGLALNGGGPPIVVRRIVDITERRRAEVDRDRIFQLAPDLLAVTGFDGYLKRVNPACTAILGWSEEELLALRYIDIVDPQDQDAVAAAGAKLAAGEEVRGLEIRVLTRDGGYRWLLVDAVPIRDEQIVYSWNVDITERRQAEERLRQREAQLAEAQRIARVGSWEFNLDGHQLQCSDELYRLFGAERGASWMDLFTRVHVDDRARVREAAIRVLKGHSFALEFRVLPRNGSERIVHVRGCVAIGPSGVIDRLAGTVQDVTDWRRAEAELAESEERFRRAFEDGPLGIAFIDRSGRFLRVNSALRQMLGAREGQLENRTVTEVTYSDGADLDVGLTRFTVDSEISGCDIETRFLRPDGEVVWGRVRCSVVRDQRGEPLYGLLLVEDITEVREAEAARRELDALKDGFLRVVSHDIQGPLATIAASANLLARDDASDGQRELLLRIAADADRLRRMAGTFLDVDRLYHGGVRARRRQTELSLLVDRVIKNVDTRGHPLLLDVAPLATFVDPDLFEHMVENLLDNACLHTPPGTPVSISVRDEAGAVSLVVEDRGPGVPEGLKQPVFDLFRTGATSGRRTGVGLWVVARFAELHGGRAWVEDRPGGGASFRVVLPPADNSPEP